MRLDRISYTKVAFFLHFKIEGNFICIFFKHIYYLHLFGLCNRVFDESFDVLKMLVIAWIRSMNVSDLLLACCRSIKLRSRACTRCSRRRTWSSPSTSPSSRRRKTSSRLSGQVYVLSPFYKNLPTFLPSLINYCLMTSAGGTPMVKKIKLPTADHKDFCRFFI